MDPAEPAIPTPRRLSPAARRRIAHGVLAVGVLALLWSAAWFYAPPIIKGQAEKIASEQLGRRVTLGAVAFNPWTLALTVLDLEVAAADTGAPPLLRVKRVRVDAALQSLFRFAPVLDGLEIESPELHLARVADGHYDIDDILQRLAAKSGAEEAKEPARFALHNIVVSHGSLDFIDAPVRSAHTLREFDLAVPFFSSLPSQRAIKVAPHLAFTLDGSRFDSAATATPFSETGSGEASIRLDKLDVAPWLGYEPKGLPAQLQSALLSADLRLAFEQRPKLSLRISGTVEVSGLKVADAASGELLSAGGVKVAIDELRPLEGLVRLRRIEVDAPHVLAVRNSKGRVNLFLAAEASDGSTQAVAQVPLPTTAASAASAADAGNAMNVASAASGALAIRGAGAPLAAASAGSSPVARAEPPSRWTLQLAELSVRAGALDWRDAMTRPEAKLALSDFSFDASAIRWPLAAPVLFKGAGTLGAGDASGKFGFSGQGNASGAAVSVTIDALPLALATPYLHAVLVPPLVGTLSADLAVDWRPGDGAPQLKIDAKRIALDALRLGDARSPEIGAERFELVDASVDTGTRSAIIGRLAVQAPRVRIERDADARWTFERWMSGGPVPASTAEVATSASAPMAHASLPASASASVPMRETPASSARPWALSIGEIAVDRGRVGFADRALAVPVALEVSNLALQLRGFALDAAKPAPFHLAARVAVPAGPTGAAVGSGFAGSVDLRGELAAFVAGVPGSVKAALLLKDLPLHLLDPYLDEVLNLDIQKAQTGFKGNLAYQADAAGVRLKLNGDATVDDFRASSVVADPGAPRRGLAMVRDGSPGRQLLNWKSLSLRGIDVSLAPGAPAQIAVAETALSDFFARVVLDEAGRINLQDVARSSAAAPASAPATSRTTAALAGASGAGAGAAAAASGTGAAIVRFGPIAVVNGRINYADRFVKPNYSANLSELTGRLGAFSSQGSAPGQPPLLADLELRGRVEGTATLEITGKVNPLARPLALDIAAKVRDLELPPLSPYAIKYAGYGIERGKMSVDLAYLVKPDGQLTASNRIVLNQLAFGDKVEGAPASLPVKLAVALLADSHGVIDLDLPVSGSINDPQFSLGGLIWKVVTSLIVKAITSPFSLLASALGSGGSELSTIEFSPGTATLLPAAKASLDKIATALADRPQLTMTVTGESRLDVERDAWKRERLMQSLRAEKRRAGLAAGASATAEVVVGEAEVPALLKEVYKRADIVKPKNVIGLAKDLPTNEMQALLLAAITVDEVAMQQLAVRRGVVVRDYLAARQLPTTRLFLGAPKTAGSDDAWTPRADLKLATD